MNILVTGSTGFIGRHLLDSLIKKYQSIFVFGKFFDEKFLEAYKDSINICFGDIRNEEDVLSCVKKSKPRYVFHLAALKERENFRENYFKNLKTNSEGTFNLLNALKGNKDLEHVVSLGTIEEYGYAPIPFDESSIENPISFYGISKLQMTKISMMFFKLYKMPITILRPSIAFGPLQNDHMFIPSIFNTLNQNKIFKMTGGNQTRDFIFVSDLINAIEKCATQERTIGQVINIGSGISYKIKEVAIEIGSLTKKSNLIKIGSVPYRMTEVMSYSVKIEKAHNLINWRPCISLEEGLKKTLESLEKN